MTIDFLTEEIRKQAATVDPAAVDSTIKLQLDDGIIYVDGTEGSIDVSNDDKDAECTVITTKETLRKLKMGELNPMMAMMTGKVKIKGNMAVAMKLQSLLGG